MFTAAYSLNASVRLSLEHGAFVTGVDPNNRTTLMHAVTAAERYELDGEVGEHRDGRNEIDEYSHHYADGDTVQCLLDNIVIRANGKAKPTDVGLSFALSSEQEELLLWMAFNISIRYRSAATCIILESVI